MTNLVKAVWGPACWLTIHATAASCDPESCAGFHAFLRALGDVLPCPECRMHLQQYLRLHPPEPLIHDAQEASRYCYDLHNYVNSETGRSLLPPEILERAYGVRIKSLKRQAVQQRAAPPRRLGGRLPQAARPYRRL